MTTTPINLKLEQLFNATDADGDGYVEWSDYQRIVDRYFNEYKIDKNDYKGQALQAMHQVYWQELRRHASGSQRLSKDEYIAAVHATSIDTSRFNMVEGLPHAIFDVLDIDGDNTISQKEFAQFLMVREITAPDAMDVFTGLDTDEDGNISRQEFIRSWREFFYSHDLNATGSLYFGHL